MTDDDILYIKPAEDHEKAILKHLLKLLLQICKIELFREISLEQEYDCALTERTARDISDAMKNNAKLEKLSIQDFVISPIVSSVLCEGLKTENRNFTSLSFYDVSFGEASRD
jgi:hypothetical protein